MIKVNLGSSFEGPPTLWWLADLAAFGVGLVLFGGITFALAQSQEQSLSAKSLQIDLATNAFNKRVEEYRSEMNAVEKSVKTLKKSMREETFQNILNDRKTIERSKIVLASAGQIEYLRMSMGREGWTIVGTAPNHIKVANLTSRLKRQPFFYGIDTLESKASNPDRAVSFHIKMKGK